MAIITITRVLQLLIHLLFPTLTTACNSLQTLYQSNAYAPSLSTESNFQGGTIITSQAQWQSFLWSFRPNYNDELIRREVDFSREKVVVATYLASASCHVEIEQVRVDCTQDTQASGNGEANNNGIANGDGTGVTSMKVYMNVFDASLGCSVKCMAVGQVVYAAATPVDWDIDEEDVEVRVTGPCLKTGTATTPTDATIEQASTQVPIEEMYQKFEIASSTSATTQPSIEETIEQTPIEEMYQKFEVIPYSLDPCGQGVCLNPNGTCAGQVNCFVDPCDVSSCDEGEVCSANYCGGCHAVCTQETTGTETTVASETTVATVTTVANVATEASTCDEGQCLDPKGLCAEIITCSDPCLETSCEEGEICMGNVCGGCYAVCTLVEDVVGGILLDTTTTGATTTGVTTTGATSVQEETTISATLSGSNAIAAISESVPTDSDLCNQIRVVYNSAALSRYLVTDVTGGTSLSIITSQDDMTALLMDFYPVSSQDNTDELQSVDFTSEQVIFATYYQWSTCNAEIQSVEYTCDGSMVGISMAVLDESAGCEIACDAEGQVVYAVVTPIGAGASLDATVDGPCLASLEVDSVTLATTIAEDGGALSAAATSTTAAEGTNTDAETLSEDGDTTSTVATSTTSAEGTEESDAETKSPTTKPSSGNLPEGIPRLESSALSLGSISSLSIGAFFVLSLLFWS